MPDAAAGRDPQDLRREAEQQADPEPVQEVVHAHPAEQPPAHPDPARRQQGVDAGFDLVRLEGADERDQRHEGDGRERRERHIEVAVRDDHVLRPEADVQPGVAVQERIGEIEQVAARRVVIAVAQPVDERGDRDEAKADPRRPGDPWHQATAVWRRRADDRPGPRDERDQNAIGYRIGGVRPTSGHASRPG